MLQYDEEMVREWAEERKLMVIDTHIVNYWFSITYIVIEWNVRIRGSEVDGTSIAVSTNAQSVYSGLQDVLHRFL